MDSFSILSLIPVEFFLSAGIFLLILLLVPIIIIKSLRSGKKFEAELAAGRAPLNLRDNFLKKLAGFTVPNIDVLSAVKKIDYIAKSVFSVYTTFSTKSNCTLTGGGQNLFKFYSLCKLARIAFNYQTTSSYVLMKLSDNRLMDIIMAKGIVSVLIEGKTDFYLDFNTLSIFDINHKKIGYFERQFINAPHSILYPIFVNNKKIVDMQVVSFFMSVPSIFSKVDISSEQEALIILAFTALELSWQSGRSSRI